MARYSNMGLCEASAAALTSRLEEQKRQIILEQNEYYKSIEAWNYPEDSYERHVYEDFIKSVDYRKYVLGID